MPAHLTKSALPAPTQDEAKKSAEDARHRAAIARDDVVFELHRRIIADGVAMSTKQLIDAGVYFDKVVGDTKTDKPTGTTGFKIIFDLGDSSSRGIRTITVEPDTLDLEAAPAYAALLPVTDDLVGIA